jgi:pyridoxal phosphate enzyme (YggS family)
MEAYNGGQRIFGENKIQEMTEKWETMPKDIQWHMIGQVQRNKVKYMAPYVTLVHGVDSYKLLKEIDKQAKNNNRKIDCLLQVHIAEEETKFGLDESELSEIITLISSSKLMNISILGLMGMATFTPDENQVRKEFRYLRSLFDKTKNTVPELSVLSMGMSGDYRIAIEEGSNMVRIGSSIFGKR